MSTFGHLLHIICYAVIKVVKAQCKEVRAAAVNKVLQQLHELHNATSICVQINNNLSDLACLNFYLLQGSHPVTDITEDMSYVL